ncbi:alcohol dehydrogenase [Arthrobacter crusticola]|uniref:Alcohol dehydrogenase n=1 Tax=Arthrobacter crusticola TaxID=2547960 RepID=A0A4R5TW67_9MICC|nr:alcohol dehydrogenase catalytic domain-containing protein [Arthrobacter crusticola]TDK25352.1 alcohol dehydrogenase [Arthrobacter crusticola]
MTPSNPTMKAAVLTAPETVAVQQVPLPEVPDGWALIRVEYTGLCGTDFSIYHGTHPRAAPPLILGHEITGTVAVAAPDGPAEGTRVVVEPLIACGTCGPCTSGNSHVCSNLNLYGIDAPGSLAEYIALPARALLPVDPKVPARQAALAEPLAVAVHAVARSGLSGGEHVAVFGAGPIGLLTALVAREAGAGEVFLIEPSEDRREAAGRFGFPVLAPGEDPAGTVRSRTGGAGADIVFDSAAHPSVAAALSGAARVQGTIVLVGVYKEPAKLDLQGITFSEQTLLGVRVYTRQDMERAVGLIEADVLQLDRLPIEVFGLGEVPEAFTKAMSAGGVLKVLVGSAGEESGAAHV